MRGKIVSLMVLLLWIFQSTISWLYFEFEKKQCLESFHRHLRSYTEKDITTLKFEDLSAVNWIEHNEEFELHGLMYDVINVKLTANGFEIKCVQDTRDTRITVAYFKTTKEDQKSHTDQKVSAKYKKVRFFASTRSFLLIPVEGFICYTDTNQKLAIPVYIKIKAPPPERSCYSFFS